MFEHAFGWPQTVALLVLVQRGLEEVYSQYNTRALLRQGGYEIGRDYYPVVAATHLGWIAGLAFLVPADAPAHLPFYWRSCCCSRCATGSSPPWAPIGRIGS